MEMTEYNFVYLHNTVAQQVIVQGGIKRLLTMLKIGSFVRKMGTVDTTPVATADEVPDMDVVQPSTSSGKNGKGRKRRRRRDKKAEAKQVVQQQVQIPTLRSDQCTMATQTDIDFEYYLELDEEQYEEYLAYKQVQLAQQYLVSEIMEQDFDD